MADYKLICTDIDGTLLNKDRVLSDKTIEVLGKITPLIPIILASSRMPKAMKHLQEKLGITNLPLICYNGALVLDYSKGYPEVMRSFNIELSVLDFVLKTVPNTNIHVSLYKNDNWYAEKLDYWAKREINNTQVMPTFKVLTEVTKDWESGPHKIMCMGPAEEIQVLYNALQAICSSFVHIYRSKDTYIEINSKEDSKASALRFLLKQKYSFGMEKVIAFGDNYNDMELLEQVGKGVAVGNARAEVIAVADLVTDSNVEDGVAKAIELIMEN